MKYSDTYKNGVRSVSFSYEIDYVIPSNEVEAHNRITTVICAEYCNRTICHCMALTLKLKK